MSRTRCNYDSLEETNRPCASSCHLLETNRGKRQSPSGLRGISSGSGVPKPGPVVCAEAWSRSEARQPVACRSPARSCAPKHCRRSRSVVRPAAGNGAPRPCPARPAEGRCRRMTARVVLPTFGNKSRKTTKSEPSTGDQF